MATVYNVSAALLGALFVIAAAGKWLNLPWFARAVARYRGMPSSAAPLAALFIVAAESAVAILLLIGVMQRAASVAAFMLILVFTVAMLAQLAGGGPAIPCGCGGTQERPKMVGPTAIARNLGLMALCMLAFRASAPPVAAAALGAGALLCLSALLYAREWARRAQPPTHGSQLAAPRSAGSGA